MRTLIHERVEAARRGENPMVICRMPSGWAVLGDQQFFRGYSLLLSDPVALDLNSLSSAERLQYLSAMAIVGDALLEVTGAYLVNYETLGNTDRALHTHVFPRYQDEPEERRKGPVWLYPREERLSRPFDADRDGPLVRGLQAAIEARL